MKKYFSAENITTFVLVVLACSFALIITPKVFGWVSKKTTTPPASS
ncbi:MAG: hypothetical protein ACLP7I_12085 [Limisphaerales bacterium]